MSIKKIIIYLVVLGLVATEGYLLFTTISGNISSQNETTQYCGVKCNYNQNVLLWEFSGENATKGFTTKDECFKYCGEVKNGFAYYLSEYGSAFLSFFNFFKR
jgi:hypothetical protein